MAKFEYDAEKAKKNLQDQNAAIDARKDASVNPWSRAADVIIEKHLWRLSNPDEAKLVRFIASRRYKAAPADELKKFWRIAARFGIKEEDYG